MPRRARAELHPQGNGPLRLEEKAEALLAGGMQAMREMRREDAEKSFREAAELAQAANDERLHARALARLQYALASQGRVYGVAKAIAEAARESIARGADPVSGLILKSCFLRFVSPKDPQCARMVAAFAREAAAHPQDVDVARAAGQMSIVCNDMGDHRLAAQLLEAALPVMQSALGASNPEYALMLYNLADVRGTLAGGYDAVLPMLRQAIAIQEAALAPGHFEKVMPLGTLGIALGLKGEYAEARRVLERALDIALAVEGPEGRTPARLRSVLAGLAERMAADPSAGRPTSPRNPAA